MNQEIFNDHWKERALERGDLNLEDEEQKSIILQELKTIMQKNPENIQPSTKDPSRFLVTGKDGLHYVLQTKRARKSGQKDMYVPITVLAPGMNFKWIIEKEI